MSKEYILQYIRDLKSVIDYHVASEFHKNRLFFFIYENFGVKKAQRKGDNREYL